MPVLLEPDELASAAWGAGAAGAGAGSLFALAAVLPVLVVSTATDGEGDAAPPFMQLYKRINTGIRYAKCAAYELSALF